MPSSLRKRLADALFALAERLGGMRVPPAQPETSTSPRPLTPARLLDIARDKVNWREQWVNTLTPIHFRLRSTGEGEVPASDPLAARLRLHGANLCILFTADWTKPGKEDPDQVAVYAGSRSHVEVPLPSPTESPPPKINEGDLDALIAIVVWTYGDQVLGDRLALVQTEIARALSGVPEAERFAGLLRRASRLLEDLRANWKLFVEGELEEYMSQIQVLEDYVAVTVENYSRQTTEMIKGLSDTTLAAVGVIVGSIVAAVLGKEPNLVLLWVGAGLYLVYLVIFPLAYNMRQRWEHHRALHSAFETRRKRFARRLPSKVDEIVGSQVKDSEDRFVRWFWWSLAAYGVVIIGVLWTVQAVARALS